MLVHGLKMAPVCNRPLLPCVSAASHRSTARLQKTSYFLQTDGAAPSEMLLSNLISSRWGWSSCDEIEAEDCGLFFKVGEAAF